MIVATGLSGLLSFFFVGLFLLLARRMLLLDQPGHRSSHRKPTPTGAGSAMIFALGMTMLIVGLEPAMPRFGNQSYPSLFGVLMAGAFGLSMLGLWDDARGIPAAWRLLAQLLTAVGFVLVLQVSAPWQIAVFVLALTWTMNAFNFMDGSDGMAGMQAVFSGVLLAALFDGAGDRGLCLAALALAAAALGFLPWNWPPSRCFMGDAGSVPLGWLLGGLCLTGAVQGSFSWPVALLVLAVFHVDSGLTLLRRFWAGERWYTAHRTHVYQKLITRGWGHGQVLLAYTALNLLIVAPAVILAGLNPQWDWVVASITFLILVIAWCAVSLKMGERP